MKENLSNIRKLIQEGELTIAIEKLSAYIQSDVTDNDEPYYLLGNAYRKQGNWQLALNNYLEAMERNPESPAVQAHKMAMDILNFYNKDMYNQ
jgi:cytochrome c-type biogenesis protein CcmH/NrfG